jgi:seryl-tRNA synthetase
VRLGPIKKSLSIDRKAGVVKEDFTNKAIMAELLRMKRAVEKILKDTGDSKSAQSSATSLLKEQDKKISSLATSLSDANSKSTELAKQLEVLKAAMDAKLDDLTAASTSALRRGSSVETTPTRSPGSEPPSQQGPSGRGLNGSRDGGSRATNSYS